MNTILEDMQHFYGANDKGLDDSAQLAELADSLPFGGPALLFVADAAGCVEMAHAADAAHEMPFPSRRLSPSATPWPPSECLRVFRDVGRAAEPVVPRSSACGWPGQRPDFSAA